MQVSAARGGIWKVPEKVLGTFSPSRLFRLNNYITTLINFDELFQFLNEYNEILWPKVVDRKIFRPSINFLNMSERLKEDDTLALQA